MSSDIVLTSALRNNLLSLQNTQRLIDDTQLRLATGLKVNSALDNPQNFFASQALSNRANDLSSLLDGISQSIRTIEAADNGVTALTNLVEQASSIVNSARDELASSDGEARLVGNVNLRNVTNNDLTQLAGVADGNQIVISTINDSGSLISETITINTGDSGDTLAAEITNAFADNRNGEISARINDSGFLEISSSGGRTFKVTTDETNELGATGFTDLGIGAAFANETRGAAATDGDEAFATTVVAGNTVRSVGLYESAGNLAEAGDFIIGTDYVDANENTVTSGLAAGDVITLNLNDGGTTRTATITLSATTTFQDIVDTINEDADTEDLIRAGFDSQTGQITLTSLSDSVSYAELVFTDTLNATDAQFDLSFGDDSGLLDAPGAAATGGDGEINEKVITFSSSTQALDSFASEYNSVREQINSLVEDAQYRGVNLLKGDDLVTFFNEDNSNTLTTEGQDFTANGLGLTEVTFSGASEVEAAATSVRDALADVRSFGSSISNALNIIQTRRDFTEQTINTLNAGADDLTIADQNEEGANLLALQTRQALGTTALSLASQSAQSVLRLF